jgi:hypothetical protein
MSLSKLLMPGAVVLSHNVIPVTVETDKYRTTLGTKQVLKVTFTDNTTAGKKITFGWAEFNMEMVFSASPNDTGLQLPLYDKTLATGYDTMIAAFKTNYYLQRYYVITSAVTLVMGNYECVMTFTQREFGQVWSASTLTGDDPTKYTPAIFTAQVMPVYSANFRFLCDVYHQNSPSGAREYDKLIAELDASGTDENIGQFNLSEIFKNWRELAADFPIDTTFQPCINVLKNYYLQLSESYGSTEMALNNITHPDPIAANTYLQVIKGGLPFLKHPGNTWAADYIDATYNKFLTAHVSGKTTVCKAQKHFLSWYQKTALTDLNLKVTLYMDDGTSVTVTKTAFSGAVVARRIYQVGVGYDVLTLDASLTSGTGPMYYEVWVEDGSAVRQTEKFKFAVDTRYNEFNNFFYFHNQYGGIDCEWLSGETIISPEFSGSELQMAVQNDYTEGNIEVNSSRARYGYQFFTGHKRNKAEIDHLVELLQSNDVRWLPDPKVRAGYTVYTDLMRMVVDKASVKELPGPSDSIYTLTFKAKEAHFEW